MKQLWHMIERYYPWLLLLLGVDCFCAVISTLDWVSSSDKPPFVFSDSVCTKQEGEHPHGTVPRFPQ